MSIMVQIYFPVAFPTLAAWAEKNGSLLAPIDELFKKHGRISQRVITGKEEFIDLDEWPSREAYAAFKTEAGPHIERFEQAFGHRSSDAIYDIL